MENKQIITIVGAGLVGSLLALYLAKRGMTVNVYERRQDPRRRHQQGQVGEGRSINLAISARGLFALSKIGLDAPVREQAIPMLGRMMHGQKNELTFQQYGKDNNQYINSISRGWLNCYLLDQAAKYPRLKIFFNYNLKSLNLDAKQACFVSDQGVESEISYDVLIGTDGSASAARHSLENKMDLKSNEDLLSHGYKEFVMPPGKNGQFLIEKNALHIWPRGPFMMIALPNADGSYTCTLFLAHEKQDSYASFADLQTDQQIQDFFLKEFPDFCQLVPDYLQQFHNHPTGKMVTLKCGPWNHKGDVLLMGDASHAIVPFFGQGMNCGFEDVVVFDQLLDDKKSWQDIFSQFYHIRKENTDAIADMAVENFVEMSAKTADPHFLYQKKIEKQLQTLYPNDYISRYSMVSFSLVPYSLAYQAGQLQSQVLSQVTKDFYPNEDIDYGLVFKKMKNQLDPVMEKIKTSAKGLL